MQAAVRSATGKTAPPRSRRVKAGGARNAIRQNSASSSMSGIPRKSDGALSARNVPEYDFNLNLATRLVEKLKSEGFAGPG